MRALVIVLLLAGVAHADKAKAQQYFHAGAEAFKKQSFEAAAENFELAYKELPLPEIAFSAAQAYRRQYFIQPRPEYVSRAVELYRVYLEKVKSGGRVGDASDGLAEMQRELDKLTAKGARIDVVQHATTRIAISPIVRGEKQTELTELSALPDATSAGAVATALLDGKPAELFTPLEVDPGDHTVEITAPGYFPQTQKRHVVEGSTELVEVTLEPKPGHLAVKTEGEVTIDGKPAAPSADLPAGHHVIVVTARGRRPVLREVDVARGEQQTVEVALEATTKRRAVPWVIGGSGVLAAAAVITALVARSHDEEMQKLETKRELTGITTDELARYYHSTSQRDAYRDAAFIAGGAAIAAGGLAAALYFFDRPTLEQRTGIGITPVVGPGGAGAMLFGSF